MPGVEEVVDGAYLRSVRLPDGAGVVAVTAGVNGNPVARLLPDDGRDRAAAIAACRRLFDLDADPDAISSALRDDPVVGPLVRACPGRRVAGVVDPNELAIRAVLGQQVSLAGAATLAGRLVADAGEPLGRPVGGVTHLFPTAERIAAVDAERLAMPAPAGARSSTSPRRWRPARWCSIPPAI